MNDLEELTSPEQARAWSRREHMRGASVALVPTMGALHDGHVRLIEHARRLADSVVVSIFVNPMQFDRPDDFDGYPRPFDEDIATCRRIGVHAVYTPTAAAIYPAGFDTAVEPGRLAVGFEGAHRPGHFRGVATVVTKLFAAVRPDVAVFGEKDAQQLAIVARLAVDLDLGVEIVAVPTVREPDGLAMSSRNRRLTPQDRIAATCIPRGLEAAHDRFRAGADTSAELVDAARAPIEAEPYARIDYVAVVDPSTFEELDGPVTGGMVIVAVWFGDVRLIDNRRLSEPSPRAAPAPR